MVSVRDVEGFLDTFAPTELAEEWDNVGLLVGDPAQPVTRLMTCLTVTPATLNEARRESASLIVTHHPLPFRPLQRITTETTPGRLLVEALRQGISIYSPHTAFDSASGGINQQLAAGVGLDNIKPLTESSLLAGLGTGRFGVLKSAIPLSKFADEVKSFLKLKQVQVVGALDTKLRRVAVGCGSAGTFLEAARLADCQAFVTGETSFHTCLEAEAIGVALILTGHYASERFAVETLADVLAKQFPSLAVWASRDEADPLVVV